MDPRTPVIVGAAITNDRSKAAEPIDLMTRTTEAALADAGGSISDRIDAVRVPWGVWPYQDPGRLVAERFGRPDASTTLTTVGGNQVYDLLTDTARQIADGSLGAAVVCGAETLRTRRADHAAGKETPYLDEREGAKPDETFGNDRPLATDYETEVGLNVPTSFYAMAENARRLRRGESVDDHRRRVAELWAIGSRVASENPHAWLRDALSPSDLVADSPSNRPIAHPYPKLMTSNLNVDQSGSVVMCSAEVAEAAGVPRDRWVFPWSGVGATDAPSTTQRWALDSSPAIRIAGGRTLELAGGSADDCRFIDLYSCFPIAVQVARDELGVDETRDWTISGGLTFAAGPLNCYCVLPAVRAVELLREHPDERAFLSGNGGYFSKHSFMVWGGSPSPNGFRTDRVQHVIDAEPQRSVPAEPTEVPDGSELESFTVTYDRDGAPDRAITSHLSPAGERHLTTTDDRSTIAGLLTL